MRAGVGVLAVVAGLALAASAFGTESTVYPGVGIGKVRLGMTRAQVAKALGPYSLVDERARIGGAAYVQEGWDFDSWSVGFLRGRVVFIGTTLRAQRTPNGIRQGSTAEQLVRAYPHGLCGLKSKLLYLVAHAGGTQTIFNLRYDFQTLPSGARKRVTRVQEIWVRQRFRPLEEFAPENRCESGWEKPRIV